MLSAISRPPHSWGPLFSAANTLGLSVLAKMTSSKELKEQLAELTDEAEALASIAEAADSGLNDEQQSRWDELMAEEGGEVAKLHQRLEQAMAYEGQKKKLATLRLARESSSDVSNPLKDTEFDQATGEMSAAELAQTNRRDIVNKFRNRGRLAAFRNDDKGREDALNCGMWFRAFLRASQNRPADREAESWCSKLGWDVLATATTLNDASGGYNVPSPLSAAFIEYRERISVIRPLADFRPMTADTLTVTKLLSGPAVTYPGEASPITESDQVWGPVNLTAVKRAILHYMSSEYQDDSIIDVMDQIVARMAYEFALQEDNEAINGDGTATYGNETGMISALGAAGRNNGAANNWAGLLLQDFTDTMGILPDKHWQGSVGWIMSSAFYHTVALKIQAAAGGNTIATLEAGGSTRPMFLGYPVYFTGHMPTTSAANQIAALFGNYRNGIILGDRSGLRMAVSDHVKFNEDRTGVRGTTRYDWEVHEPGDGSDAGAYVALATPV